MTEYDCLADGEYAQDRRPRPRRFCLPGNFAGHRCQAAVFHKLLGWAVSRLGDSGHRAGGTWIERHEHVGFYLCAAAFAIVLIGYRVWWTRNRSAARGLGQAEASEPGS